MIQLNKQMPNGASCILHRIQTGYMTLGSYFNENNELLSSTDISINYQVLVNSYSSVDIFGPISWQDTYNIPAGSYTTLEQVEQALILTPEFAQGVIIT